MEAARLKHGIYSVGIVIVRATRLFTYFRIVLSTCCFTAASFVVYALLDVKKCAFHVKVHVTAAASAVPLARGVRYLDRFCEYGPLFTV